MEACQLLIYCTILKPFHIITYRFRNELWKFFRHYLVPNAPSGIYCSFDKIFRVICVINAQGVRSLVTYYIH